MYQLPTSQQHRFTTPSRERQRDLEVGRVCDNLKKKVKKVVQEKCEQWTGEMNPNPNPSDINVSFAEIDDEIDNEMLTTAGVKILLTKTSKTIKGDRKIKDNNLEANYFLSKKELCLFLRCSFDSFNCVIKFVFSIGYYFGND